MKKIFTFLSFVSLFSLQGFTQSYYYLSGTGSSEPYVTSLPEEYDIILTADREDASSQVDEVLSTEQTIPFTFTFGGSDYTKYKLSDNGYITFDLTETTSNSTNVTLPSSSAPTNSIMAFWDNLEFEQYQGFLFAAVSYTSGVAPNRTHVIKWFQANHVDRDAELNELLYLGIALHENGSFDIIHEGSLIPNGGKDITESATIGYNIDDSDGVTIEGPSATFPTIAANDASDDKVYSFFPGPRKGLDIGIVATEMDDAAALSKNEPLSIVTAVRNYGTTAITSLDLNYTVNNGSVVTDNYITNIAPGEIKSFTHQTSWTPTSAGDFTIAIYTSNPNGGTDEDVENDNGVEFVKVYENVADRTPLYEIFTSSTCGPCTPGNANFENVVRGKEDECTFIKYQQNFPSTGDPYANAESVNRRGFYGVNSIPRMQIDGGWDGNANSFSSSLHEEAVDLFSLVTINASFDKWAQEVSANIEVSALEDVGNVSIYAAVIETITDKNVKTNGETEFTHVFKRFMSGFEGEEVSLAKGASISKSYNVVFQGDYRLPSNGQQASWINVNTEHSVENFENLSVLVWVQDNSTLQVLQSAYAEELNLNVRNLEVLDLNVYPNPASDMVNVVLKLDSYSPAKISLTNAMGTVVNSETINNLNIGSNSLTVNLADQSNGVYFLTVETETGINTQKITVSH